MKITTPRNTPPPTKAAKTVRFPAGGGRVSVTFSLSLSLSAQLLRGPLFVINHTSQNNNYN